MAQQQIKSTERTRQRPVAAVTSSRSSPGKRSRSNAAKAEIKGTQAVDRALSLLTLIASRAQNGWALQEIIATTKLNKATARRLLTALMRFGFLEQNPDTRHYLLGPESYSIGLLAERRFGIHRLARDSLRRIAAETGDSAFLTVRRASAAVCIWVEEGEFPIKSRVLQPGQRHSLAAGASSIAMLAALSDEEIERVLIDAEPVIRTQYPLHNMPLIRDLIAETRERGYCMNRGLITPGSWTIAMAIRDYAGEPDAAVSISTIEGRLDDARQQQVYAVFRREAKVIEASLREHKIALHGRLG